MNTRSGITGRLKYRFDGEGQKLRCIVTGVIDGEELTYESPEVGQITTKNSPLWNSDPQQQLGYFASRSWARRHTPEVLLGVYDREEVQSYQGPDKAKDVTPSLQERLAQRRHVEPADEGFDQSSINEQLGQAKSDPEMGEVAPEVQDIVPDEKHSDYTPETQEDPIHDVGTLIERLNTALEASTDLVGVEKVKSNFLEEVKASGPTMIKAADNMLNNRRTEIGDGNND